MAAQTSTISVKRFAARRRQRTGNFHTIFNASPLEWVRVRACGVQHDIPPNGPGHNPRGKGEFREHWGGLHAVRDVYCATPEEVAQELSQPGFRASRSMLYASADDQLAYLLQNVKGICLITGDEKVDQAAKSRALAEWVKHRHARAMRTRASYEARIAPWASSPRNAGKPAPPMTPSEIEAEEFLDAHALGKFDVDERPASTYICDRGAGCGYHTDDPERFAIHIAAQHPDDKAVSGKKPGRPAARSEPPPPPPA